MKKNLIALLFTSLIILLALPACQSAASPSPAAELPVQGSEGNSTRATARSSTAGDLQILAVETFLADIAQNVAGDRAEVGSLIPLGLDPHAFQPTPADIVRISDSQLLIINGAGFEEWLSKSLENAGGERRVVEASAGLKSRAAQAGEEAAPADEAHDEGDPHFWLDPVSVIRYVENIRDGLIAVDPEGEQAYRQNAETYIQQLEELDAWIRQQVSQIPEGQRAIVTNHESFGYFADRYGFKIIGTIVPGVSTGASPSAQQLARLVDQVRAADARVIFLETGSSSKLAEQIAAETGIKVVTELYSHSITSKDGPAPTYLDMMKANTEAIVEALLASQPH